MRGRAFAALLALLLGGAAPLGAHELRPAYLELRERAPERFEVRFRVPARGEARLALDVVLPERCRDLGPHTRSLTRDAVIERWSTACEGGLTGAEIRIAGLAGTLTDVLARVERSDGTSQVSRATPSAPGFTISAAPAALDVTRTYLALGIEHILLGVDHLLFVLALLLIVGGGRQLVVTITAFTLAHSVTLAGATLGVIRMPQQPVEAVIALSIVFVAREILRAGQGPPGLTVRRPWLAAFAFGLLHGLGFAGALREVGLPERSIPLALLFFNLGVEAGQLLLVASVLALRAAARRYRLPAPERTRLALAYGIGALASYWTLERVVGFWR